MKIVTYNVQYGLGSDLKFDLERIAGELEGADVMALQEVERFWTRSGNTDQLAFFTERFPDHYWAYGPGVDLHLPGSLPKDNRRRQFGNMVLSRYPISFIRNHFLPKRSSIGPLSIQRTALETTLLIGDFPLRVYSFHLTHISSQTRQDQVRRILQIHRDAVHEGFPLSFGSSGLNLEPDVPDRSVADQAILLGDFNFAPDSPEYQMIVGPQSDYGGHVISEDGFIDAWTFCGGDPMSGHTGHTLTGPTRMDYCFVSTPIRNRIASCRVDENANGSDHQPVWLEFDL